MLGAPLPHSGLCVFSRACGLPGQATSHAVLCSGHRVPSQVSPCMHGHASLGQQFCLCFSGSSRPEGRYPHFSQGRELC